jgi:integrase
MEQNMVPALIQDLSALELAAQIADQVAKEQTLADYRFGKEDNTIRRQRGDLALFEKFLAEAGAPVVNLSEDLQLWRPISAGLVKAYQRWQLTKGYRIDSINVRISTIKTYMKLAAQAGHVSTEQAQLVELIHEISHKEGRNFDATREQTSVGAKKSEPTRLSPSHVAAIKQQLLEETMRGDTLASRDLLLFILPAEHSLRCSELHLLRKEHLELEAGELRIYRKKTDRWQRHILTPAALIAAQWYLKLCAVDAWLFPGEAPGTSLATRSIYDRIVACGKRVDLEKLGPHDLRHYFATFSKGDVGALMQAGGWSSPAMPMLYRVEQEIANKGILVPGQPGWEA